MTILTALDISGFRPLILPVPEVAPSGQNITCAFGLEFNLECGLALHQSIRVIVEAALLKAAGLV